MAFLLLVFWLQHPPTPVPHGDHNPKHGGIFFMAPDLFHHLEGVIEAGEFRLYIYNNLTQPMDARAFRARVGVRQLEPVTDGTYLRMPFQKPTGDDPPEVTAFVQLAEGGLEERFDFVFMAPPDGDVLPDFVIPEKPEEIFREILARDSRIQALMVRGTWSELFIPALEAKDLALALESRLGATVSVAVKKVLRAAWLLDAYGDQGNREKVESTYRLFEAGIADLRKVYAR